MQSQRDRRNWRLFFRLSIAAAVISALFGYSQGQVGEGFNMFRFHSDRTEFTGNIYFFI